jgi:hypothetical protein
MTDDMVVDLDLLEETFSVLIARLRAAGGPTFRLDRDYYWSIPQDQVFDVYSNPEGLTIGQVSECLDWLEGLRADHERALPYHLVWLGDVLHAIGYRGEADFVARDEDSG